MQEWRHRKGVCNTGWERAGWTPAPREALFSKHSAKRLCNVGLPLYPGKKREEKKAKGGLAGSF